MSDEQRRPGHLYDPANPVPEHLRPPAEGPPTKGVRDVDSTARAQRIHAFGWASFAGVPGALLGYLWGHRADGFLAALLGPDLGGLAGAVLGAGLAILAAGGGALWLAGTASRVGATLYMPGGASTPGARQYSLADALAARGQYGDAAAELERCVLAWPDDVEPKLRLARLLRAELQRPERAAHWFRRALDTPGVPAASEQAVLRELVELYTHRLGQPRAAAPWLARLAERHRGTPAGAWAARALSVLKQEMRDDDR